MRYEDAYNFSPELLDLINRGQEQLDAEDDQSEPTEDSTVVEEDDRDYDSLQKQYDDLAAERDALQQQIEDYRFSSNEDIRNDDLLQNTYEDNNNSVLNMILSDENRDIEWIKKKNNEVNLQGLNPTLKSYLNTLPDNLKNELVATSGNDQEHVKGSKHYDNKALDLRYVPNVHDYISKDPLAKKYGIKTLDPNHGTAPHTHIYLNKYGGDNMKDGGDPVYIKRNSKGQKELVGEKLPLTNKYDDTRTWMIDWLKQRNSQYSNLAPAQYKEDHPFLSLFGTNSNDIKETVNKLRSEAINNVKTVGYGDESVIPGDALIDMASGTYVHGDHRIYFPAGQADKGTAAHETGHASLLADKMGIKNYIWDTIENDTHVKKERDSYYHSPGEVYSRIWDLRRTYGFKPNETITPQLLRDRKKKHDDSSFLDDGSEEIYKYLDEATILKLLNGLVSTDKKSGNVAKFGGKYKVN